MSYLFDAWHIPYRYWESRLQQRSLSWLDEPPREPGKFFVRLCLLLALRGCSRCESHIMYLLPSRRCRLCSRQSTSTESELKILQSPNCRLRLYASSDSRVSLKLHPCTINVVFNVMRRDLKSGELISGQILFCLPLSPISSSMLRHGITLANTEADGSTP